MRMHISVGPDGDYRTIGEAIQAAHYDSDVIIEIAEGTYREKLYIEKKNITLKGAGPDRTVITYSDGAKDIMPDGSRRGTFRSQTVFLSGEYCEIRDLTIENGAGTGMEAGQALAVYADASRVYMENVILSSHQDTLFVAPLPTSERQPGGFFGPRMLNDRLHTVQYYKNCVIKGDVDFIFGGADAVFDECEIIVCDRGEEINGYITAPSENLGKLGLCFRRCLIHGQSDDMAGTVFLGRPWRPTGRAVFMECRYDECIHKKRFSEWGTVEAAESEAFFAEYRPTDMSGADIDIKDRNPWVLKLDDSEAKKLNDIADSVIKRVIDK